MSTKSRMNQRWMRGMWAASATLGLAAGCSDETSRNLRQDTDAFNAVVAKVAAVQNFIPGQGIPDKKYPDDINSADLYANVYLQRMDELADFIKPVQARGPGAYQAEMLRNHSDVYASFSRAQVRDGLAGWGSVMSDATRLLALVSAIDDRASQGVALDRNEKALRQDTPASARAAYQQQKAQIQALLDEAQKRVGELEAQAKALEAEAAAGLQQRDQTRQDALAQRQAAGSKKGKEQFDLFIRAIELERVAALAGSKSEKSNVRVQALREELALVLPRVKACESAITGIDAGLAELEKRAGEVSQRRNAAAQDVQKSGERLDSVFHLVKARWRLEVEAQLLGEEKDMAEAVKEAEEALAQAKKADPDIARNSSVIEFDAILAALRDNASVVAYPGQGRTDTPYKFKNRKSSALLNLRESEALIKSAEAKAGSDHSALRAGLGVTRLSREHDRAYLHVSAADAAAGLAAVVGDFASRARARGVDEAKVKGFIGFYEHLRDRRKAFETEAEKAIEEANTSVGTVTTALNAEAGKMGSKESAPAKASFEALARSVTEYRGQLDSLKARLAKATIANEIPNAAATLALKPPTAPAPGAPKPEGAGPDPVPAPVPAKPEGAPIADAENATITEAPPKLPDFVAHESIGGLVRIDGRHLSPKGLLKTVEELLGPEAGKMAAGQINTVYAQKFAAFAQSGATGATMLIESKAEGKGEDFKNPAEHFMLVALKDGISDDVAKAIASQLGVAAEGKRVSLNYFAFLPAGASAVPAAGAADRLALFDDALKANGDAAVTLAFVPTAANRADIKARIEARNTAPGAPVDMSKAAPYVDKTIWFNVSLKTGTDVGLYFTSKMSDAATVTQAKAEIDGQLKTLFAPAPDDSAFNPITMMKTAGRNALVVKADGDKLSVSMAGDSLKALGKLAGPMLLQQLGGGAGPGPGAPPEAPVKPEAEIK